MTKLPLSVVIPTYNRAALLRRAVRSALECCRDGDEIIIVDDGSSDDTERAVAEFGERVVFLRNSHGGAGKARNTGIDRASRALIAFLDSDDEWMPGSLEIRRRLLEARPDVLFCFTNFGVRTPAGEFRRYLARWHDVPLRWEEIMGPGVPYSSITELSDGHLDPLVHIGDLYLAELTANYVLTSTLVVKREAAGSLLRFAEDLPSHEDWLCFGQIARAGAGAYIDCETAWQYGHSGFRLSGIDDVARIDARRCIVERVWARDTAFLSRHGEAYQRRLRDLSLSRIRALIARGRTVEARADLARTTGAPFAYTVLAHVPGPVIRALAALRRTTD
jgi:glycosyltransferase involved in cell wall biosynthesis